MSSLIFTELYAHWFHTLRAEHQRLNDPESPPRITVIVPCGLLPFQAPFARAKRISAWPSPSTSATTGYSAIVPLGAAMGVHTLLRVAPSRM